MQILESLELIGPGRWLDRPHIILQLQLDEPESQILQVQARACYDRLNQALRLAGIEAIANPFSQPEAHPIAAAQNVALWLGQTAILLQRWAGHRVFWSSSLADEAPNTVRAMYEIEDLASGKQAGELALMLVSQALLLTEQGVDRADNAARLDTFRAAAEQRVFPLDAELLITAAMEHDIPACKLDREPYEPIRGDFRRRNNGLLRFGHACYQQVVDGTLCLQRSAKVLQELGQASAGLAYLRRVGAPVANPEDDINGLHGQPYRFLCAGQQFLAVVDSHDTEVTEECHSSWLEFAATVAQQLELGMLVLNAVAFDLSKDWQHGKGFFTGLDISPQLDFLLPTHPELCRLMADEFIQWMFPPGSKRRIPLLSVTGTNGKTTICRMLTRIASTAGYRVGLACTDGVYLNDGLVDTGDYSGGDGHHRILESHDINLAILETARGAVLHSGFMFDHSDVAVCTNVTAEHLGEYGINTVEEMSDIKRLIVAKARRAAVLNFDDVHCRRIGTDLTVPRLCWTSVSQPAELIFAQAARAEHVICIDSVEGVEWIVSHQHGNRQALMPVSTIPATFDGTARHNVSNALQAIAAALELGIRWDDVHQAMTTFAMGVDSTPGRLNLHEACGFPVLLDFVQNLDGMRVLCEFVAGREVGGRRILVFSVLGRHDDATVREFARHAAQNFDFFICRNYAKTYPHRSLQEIPELLRTTLLEQGIAAENIRVILDEGPAIDAALKLATADDLVVILCGIRPRENWQQISDFATTNTGTLGSLPNHSD